MGVCEEGEVVGEGLYGCGMEMREREEEDEEQDISHGGKQEGGEDGKEEKERRGKKSGERGLKEKEVEWEGGRLEDEEHGACEIDGDCQECQAGEKDPWRWERGELRNGDVESEGQRHEMVACGEGRVGGIEGADQVRGNGEDGHCRGRQRGKGYMGERRNNFLGVGTVIVIIKL